MDVSMFGLDWHNNANERQNSKTANESLVQVINNRAILVKFVLEPWGDIFEMNPQDAFEIRLSAIRPSLALDFEEDKIICTVLYGDTAVSVFHKETLLTSYPADF